MNRCRARSIRKRTLCCVCLRNTDGADFVEAKRRRVTTLHCTVIQIVLNKLVLDVIEASRFDLSHCVVNKCDD